MGMVGFPLRNDCATAVTFWRTQIAGLLASQVYNQFLQNDSRIHHTEFQRVITRFVQSVCRFADADAVLDRLFPGFWRIVGENVDGLWQLWDKPYLQTLHDKAAQTVVVKVSA